MIAIEPLGPDDFEAWLPLWRGYQAFYRTDIAEEATHLSFRRMLDPAEPVFGSLARQDGRAVGLVHHVMHRSTWTVGDYCYLQDLFVSPEVRGGGVGRQLIEHVYAAARRHGCARVYWLTHESNLGAMRLYDSVAERSGFLQYRKAMT